jgi:excisionase family DNA binding protein
MRARTTAAEPGWVTLTEACRLLGVSPSTVRRWADSGMVRTFVTPGGHRRFSRAGLDALLPARPSGHPSLTALGETPGRMARGYRRATSEGAPVLPWIATLDAERRERFRHHGRVIVSSLIATLDATDERTRARHLGEAEAACTEYGRLSARDGIAASVTADLFLRYRRPFLDELGALARRRELDAAACSSLIGDATAALDDLLLATLRGWEAAAIGTRRRPPRPTPTSNGSPS